MSAKHTPAPWSMHQYMGGEHITDCLPEFTAHTVYIGSGEVLIAEVSAYKHEPCREDGGYPRVTDFDVNRANANLIIAAPDMLEALQRVNDWCCYATEEDTAARLMALQQIGKTVRDAILKATGEQP